MSHPKIKVLANTEITSINGDTYVDSVEANFAVSAGSGEVNRIKWVEH